MIAAGVALVARGSAPPPSTSLPRFEPHGRDVGVALGIEEGPTNEEVAAEVKRDGFYAGAPVGAGDCVGCHRDVAAQWASSAHRFSSFNNPYYRVATEPSATRRAPSRRASAATATSRSWSRQARWIGRRSIAARARRRPASPASPAIRSRTSTRRQRPLRGRPAPGADGEGRARPAAAAGADGAGAVLRRLPQGRPGCRRHGGRALAAWPERLRRLAHQRRLGQRRRLRVPARGDEALPGLPHAARAGPAGRRGRQEGDGALAPVPGREHRPARLHVDAQQERRALDNLRGPRPGASLDWNGRATPRWCARTAAANASRAAPTTPTRSGWR